MDVAQFTAKERKQARKSLLKQIDAYNKQVRKSASFPISSPSQDLVFKGIVKITYDRGYALQTKSLLLENTTSSAEAVEDLFDAFGLRGRPSDYALEERNIMTGEIRIVESGECPLKLQLNYGPHQTYMELRLVQLRDTLGAPALSTVKLKGGNRKTGEEDGSDSDDTLNGSNPNIAVPKEEVIDHGISSVELVMEEAVQDIPPLAHDIQERLKGLSESVAVDGKPRQGLPTRRALWDTLKPKASALVKDIRRLVDIGEFIANRHCKSPVVKLIVTLVLELITDHSRELVTVTKEMCGLKGSSRTDFNSSVSRFIQQITYISKLVGKTNDSLHAMALTGHLLGVTNPEKFQQGKLTNESYFTGSGSVSGVLLFTVVSAYLGLVRAGYEEKYDFFASLASNMLRSAQKALEIIQKTDEYGMLHLHPLRSRVRDMEHKLKVAMDNLIRGVKLASSPRSPPDVVPEMLLCGHALTMATLDFLMVAQCASLVHKVVVAGWEIMQFPWVRSLAEMTLETRSDTTAASSTVADHLSSFGSDSASSHSTSTTESNSASVSYGRVARPGMHIVPVEKATSERRSRVTSKHKESDDKKIGGETGGNGRKLSFNQLGVSPQHLRIGSYDSGNEADDERALSSRTATTAYSSPVKTDTDETNGASTDVESLKSTAVSSSNTKASSKRQVPSSFEMESSRYMGYDAVKKIRFHYAVNKAIAKGAESLLLSVTQKMNSLSMVCRDCAKDKYSGIVELILGAARQIMDEVSAMEVDLQIGEKLTELLDKSKVRMENATREVQMVTIMASNQSAPESAEMKLLAAVGNLKDICSKIVADALSTTSEHKKFLEQAEKIEKEFVSLMTGQTQSDSDQTSHDRRSRRNYSSTGRLTSGDESESSGLVFEDTRNAPFATGSRGWAAKETPRVIGGTLTQLIQRLTYHRTIDSEFAETFLMTFYTFMSPDKLMDALIDRYSIEPPEDSSSWQQEAFETDVLIPVRLRVVHAMRLWLTYNCKDFKKETLRKKLQSFIKTVKESMPSSATRLSSIHTANIDCGHGTGQSKLPNSKAPTPLVPVNLYSEDNFDLLDVNTLELARQLSLAYADALRHITSEELLSISWVDESNHASVPNIMNFLRISTNLSNLVSREVVGESVTEDQTSVLSYFIQTAKSCLDLRNYEAVFAIVKGLENPHVQKRSASWQMVTDHLVSTYKEMRELVSADINYHKYWQSIRSVHQSPCVPRLCLVLSDLEAIDKDNFNFIPEMPGIINFQKRRQLAKVIQAMLRYQGIQYNLHPIEGVQKYLVNFQKSLTDEELEALSTKLDT